MFANTEKHIVLLYSSVRRVKILKAQQVSVKSFSIIQTKEFGTDNTYIMCNKQKQLVLS